MKHVLFFGDSLTAGENSGVSFVDYLFEGSTTYNVAVSGTTIGEYSIYPVDGESLLGQINRHQNLVEKADVIFIEYGSNDVSAIMCGFATLQTVVVSLVKAIDWIKQLNPNAKIVYLAPGNSNIIEDRAWAMCHYLEDDYFAKFDFKFPESVYAQTFLKVLDNVRNICDIIYMFDADMEFNDNFISDDGIHPNEYGHIRIAKNIMNQYI